MLGYLQAADAQAQAPILLPRGWQSKDAGEVPAFRQRMLPNYWKFVYLRQHLPGTYLRFLGTK